MTRVLFVCVHNAGRSQMAEAMFNRMVSSRGIDAHSESAGTIAGKAINPTAVLAMSEIGISLEAHQPKLITQERVDAADLVISMGCGVDAAACPARFILAEDWELEDPAGQPIETVRQIRDQIQSRVEALLDRLAVPAR